MESRNLMMTAIAPKTFPEAARRCKGTPAWESNGDADYFLFTKAMGQFFLISVGVGRFSFFCHLCIDYVAV